MPRPAAIALAATGRLICDWVIAASARPTPASPASRRTKRITSIVSHALPPTLGPSPPAAETLNQSKMNMISRSATPTRRRSARPFSSCPLFTPHPESVAENPAYRWIRRRRQETVQAAPSGEGLPAAPAARGGERVREQHRDRHRPDPAGHRRDRSGDLAGRGEVHVADEPVVGAVDADVDDGRRPGLTMSAPTRPGEPTAATRIVGPASRPRRGRGCVSGRR